MRASNEIFSLVSNAGGMVQFVMSLLFALSVTSWAIVIYKYKTLSRARKESKKFLEIFWNANRLDTISESCKKLSSTPLAELFQSAYHELVHIKSKQSSGETIENSDTKISHAVEVEHNGIDNIDRALRRASLQEITALERYVSFLATTGSTAPFIGLFGTVWGIMRAFINIGVTKDTSLAVVAPGISEALIATAMGLFAAIPAVVFYNLFQSKIRVLATEMENFSADFLNIIKRHFF